LGRDRQAAPAHRVRRTRGMGRPGRHRGRRAARARGRGPRRGRAGRRARRGGCGGPVRRARARPLRGHDPRGEHRPLPRRGAHRDRGTALGPSRPGSHATMSRVRLTALRVRGVLARALARTAMRLVPPAPLALVAGLPDTEENSLVTALALARRFRGRIVLVAREPAAARAALARTARVLGVDHVDRVEVRAKRDPTTPWLFVRATWVAYTHGLFDSP